MTGLYRNPRHDVGARPRTSGRGVTVRRKLALVVLALALAVGFARPAGAHAQLVSTTPTSGQELADSPTVVTLRFSEGVRPVAGGIRVIAEDGTRVDDASPKSAKGTINLPLPRLADGAYVVSWRVVSEDGHPVRGAFTFRVGGTGDQAIVAKLAEQLLVSGTSSTDVSALAASMRMLAFLTMALLIGAVSHALFVDRRSGGTGAGVARLVRWSTVVAGLSGAGSVVLYGPLVTGRSLGAVFDGPLLNDSLGDHVGQALVARTIGLVLLGAAIGGIMRPPRALTLSGDRVVVGALAGLVGLVAVAQAFTGHGGTGRHLFFALPATVVHVVAMGVWAGGLVCLLIGLRSPDSSDHLGMTRRFSRLAGVSVGAPTITGTFALWRQAGSIAALRQTPSGKLLLIKLGLVALLVLAGAKNRRALSDTANVVGPLNRIRPTIGVEAVLFAAILGVTALVVNLAPARDVLTRPTSITVTTQTGLVDITIDPAQAGPNELHIYALTTNGAQRPIEAIKATLTNAAAGIDRLDARIVRAGPNHFQALQLDLPLAGTWTIDVSITIDAFTEETGSASFSLS